MLQKPIPRGHPQETLSRVCISVKNFNENKTGTYTVDTAEDLGIKRAWRRIVNRAGLIDADRNADIEYKRIPVAYVSILKEEPK